MTDRERDRDDLRIDVVYQERVNLAMQQNAVPIVQSVRLTNSGAVDLHDLVIALRTEPQIARAQKIRVERLGAGTSCEFSPVDLPLDAELLVRQIERERGALHVRVTAADDEVATTTCPLEVLAYDEWSGTAALQEILAAYVLPNHPDVESVLMSARDILAERTEDPSLDGYQSESRRRVHAVVGAIYEAIRRLEVTYINPPASFEISGQKVRTPDRIMAARMGTCLDLTLLIAACIEQSGLHALVFLKEGHAWAGAWLEEETFATPALAEALAIRKRIDLDLICAIETTCLATRPQGSFATALAAGRAHLEQPESFLWAVDVRAARRARIRPIPMRAAPGARAVVVEVQPVHEDRVPAERRAEGAPRPARDETPRSRLDRWKRRLLDLSLRNRLLNFRPTKKTLSLLCPDLAKLEDALADGATFQILPRPTVMAGEDPRSATVHTARTGEDALHDFLLEELDDRRLHGAAEPDDLDRRLLEIYRAARLGLEESGANTLYVALGFLKWFEAPHSARERRAPLLLVPIEIVRKSVRSGFKVRLLDDEARVNVTLLRKLESEFGLRIEGLDTLPQDAAGIDVPEVFRIFRRAILHMDRWDVEEQAAIGQFSFTKYLMWLDLEQRADELRKNAVIDHLVERAGADFGGEGTFPDPSRLDETHRAEETFCPLDADSSQLAAVHAAAEGRTFVLQGPPGTGKSQTITNLIAHCLSRGQRVLFVAEKTAALNVVLNRLERIGVGPFCLPVHSNKANKRQVLERMGEALDAAGAAEPLDWKTLNRDLERARRALNVYCEALHRPRGRLGMSAFEALSALIGLRDAPASRLDLGAPDKLEPAFRESMRRVVAVMRSEANVLGGIPGHALLAVHRAKWSIDVPQDAAQRAVHVLSAAGELRTAVAAVADAGGFTGRPLSRENLEQVCDWCELMRTAPEMPNPALLVERGWSAIRDNVQRAIERGRDRDARRERLTPRYDMSLLDAPLEDLLARLRRSRQSWFVVGWFVARPARAAMACYRKDGRAPETARLIKDIEESIAVRDASRTLAAADHAGNRLFGALWRRGEADWDRVETTLEWAGRARALAARVGGESTSRRGERQEQWSAIVVETPDSVADGGSLRVRLDAARAAQAQFELRLQAFDDYLSVDEAAAYGAPTAPDWLECVETLARAVESQSARLRSWCDYQRARAEALDLGLREIVTGVESGAVSPEQMGAAFEHGFHFWWVRGTFTGDPVLGEFSSTRHGLAIDRFRELDRRVIELTEQTVRARLASRLPRAAGSVTSNAKSEMGILRRQLQLKRRHMPLRKLFASIPNVLARLKPCLLMSPLSVAQYLSPAFPPFDLVVFDEASQIPVWDAVGAIARGERLVVVGDSKQLPPTSFFEKEDTDDDLGDDDVEELESILDECKAAGLPERTLNWHYRSRHESLIAFSNHHYYMNRLLTFPSADSAPDRLGVSFRFVESGVFDRGRSRTNRPEAAALVAEVVRRLRDPRRSRQTLGVVTFSQAQQSLVEDLLDEERRSHPELESFFSTDAVEPVFVKNLENVQGDERDVILFSVGYGPDSQGRVFMNFGALNRSGGERRLNVAITRAREQVIVFSSIRGDAIDLTRTRATGVHHLRTFLDYAERGPSALPAALSVDGGAPAESPFEEDVEEALTARGWTVHRQIGCSNYRIDLGVVHPDHPGRYVLGIECDGAQYHSGRTARDRDRLRAAVLRDLGWRLHRIWSTDWWYERDRELARLEAEIERAIAEPAVDAAGAAPAASPEVREAPADPEVRDPVRFASASPTPVLDAYVPYPDTDVRGTPESFYEAHSELRLLDVIHQVVAFEAPIVHDLVIRRVAPMWGLERITKRVKARLSEVIGRADVHVQRSYGQTVLWRRDQQPEEYRDFRIPGDRTGGERTALQLPIVEVATAVAHVLDAHISMPREDLSRELARLFGFLRLGANVKRQMGRGIDLALSWGACVDTGDAISTPT